MKRNKVKVFNAYGHDKDGEEYYYNNIDMKWKSKYEFHNHIIGNDGYVEDDDIKFKPREQDIVEVDKFDLEDKDKDYITSLHNLIEDCKAKIRQAETDEFKFYRNKMKEMGFDNPEEFWLGTWDCPLSPFNQCVCHWDGNDDTCIFCGEPEERK